MCHIAARRAGLERGSGGAAVEQIRIASGCLHIGDRPCSGLFNGPGGHMFQRTTLALFTLAVSGAAFAGSDKCNVPKDQWQPIAALEKKLTTEGWKIKKAKVDDGCYEVYGTDANGKRVEQYFNPKTFEMVKG
jgi:hypothetical protein